MAHGHSNYITLFSHQGQRLRQEVTVEFSDLCYCAGVSGYDVILCLLHISEERYCLGKKITRSIVCEMISVLGNLRFSSL